MDPDDQLDDFMDRMKPMSDSEMSETLLTYFGDIIRNMDRAELRALRARLKGMHPGTKVETTIFEVIDGAVALREIDGGSMNPVTAGVIVDSSLTVRFPVASGPISDHSLGDGCRLYHSTEGTCVTCLIWATTRHQSTTASRLTPSLREIHEWA